MRDILPALVLLLCSLSSSLSQANLTVEDFAYKAEIHSTSEGFHRLELPITLMLQLTRSDLADINVFDAEGRLLPSLVQQVPASKQMNRTVIPSYPFNQYTTQGTKVITTRVQTQVPDQTSEVETTETLSTLKSNQIFIIEIPSLLQGNNINNITLDTTHSPSDYLLELRVDIGTSLDAWQTLYPKKTIRPATSISPPTNSITGIPKGTRYLRLTPKQPITEFTLTRAVAHTIHQTPIHNLWHKLSAEKMTFDDQDFYLLEIAHNVRNSRLKIVPDHPESFVRGDLYGSHTGFPEKKIVINNIHQHNYSSDQFNKNVPTTVDLTRYKKWWFAPKQNAKTTLSFEIGFSPYEIQFYANQSPPFTLAWGRADHHPIHSLPELLSESKPKTDSISTTIHEVITAGGDEKRHPSTTQTNSKAWILWAVLILAVLITGVMALGLLRDLKKEDDSV